MNRRSRLIPKLSLLIPDNCYTTSLSSGGGWMNPSYSWLIIIAQLPLRQSFTRIQICVRSSQTKSCRTLAGLPFNDTDYAHCLCLWFCIDASSSSDLTHDACTYRAQIKHGPILFILLTANNYIT